jgi:hypothetical protein
MAEQDITVHKIEELSQNEIFNFAKRASEYTSDPAHVNMWHNHWEDHPETLPYLIYISKRFANNNGQFFVLRIDNEIEAISGVHVSNFDSNVALGGVRSWVNEPHRAKFLIGRHLLPLQLSWAKDKGLKTIALTFNEYNKRLLNHFRRSGLGIKKKRNPNSLFYNGVNEAPFPCNVQYTKQWVIYHKIDENYEPNWENIKWVDK